jgi:adenylate cyclase
MKTRFYLKKSTVKRFAICAAIFVFAFLLSFSNVLYNIDSIFSDRLYQHGAVPNPKIKIVAIDERTIKAYGDVSSWTRDISAALVDRLIGDG